jgi:ATP-dependent Clp protease ATP-binding subunit ClpX
MSTALAKKIAGVGVGNVLLIGSSGTGKTTLMRAVEAFLAADPELAAASTLVRVHANVLAEEGGEGRAGEGLLLRLLEQAREQAGEDAETRALLGRIGRGIAFVDEIDKIRGSIGGKPNVKGIRAQEALLTLIENEQVPMRLPSSLGGELVRVDASGLLFVCAGAFEGLYDAVYDRVTIGSDRGALQAMNVVEGSGVRGELQFQLRDWLRDEDLFDYGMTPQFLARFDSIVLLEDLDEDALVRIFLESPESGLRQARELFLLQGIDLALSPAAARRIAQEALQHSRLGARALKEVFRRVIRRYEYEPQTYARDGKLLLDLAEVEAAL